MLDILIAVILGIVEGIRAYDSGRAVLTYEYKS